MTREEIVCWLMVLSAVSNVGCVQAEAMVQAEDIASNAPLAALRSNVCIALGKARSRAKIGMTERARQFALIGSLTRAEVARRSAR